MKTLLVGGGITSALIGFFLHNKQGITSVDVWEKNACIGGRMQTLCSEHSSIPIDIGAQYITTNQENFLRHHTIYESLLNYNVIKELNVAIKNLKVVNENQNYVAPNGMSSVVQHFFNIGNHNVFLSRNLTSLNMNELNIEAETSEGSKEFYDAVVLTMPVPEVLNLSGNLFSRVNQQIYDDLLEVKFSSRYVLILVYDKPIQEEWAACYTPNDSLIRYIAIQEKKVNAPHHQSSVTIHSSTNLDEKFAPNSNENIQSILMDHVSQLFPAWGKPVDMIFHKWNHSQVTKPFQTSSKILILNAKPLIILAGDSFCRSNFDSCIESAKMSSDALLKTATCNISAD